MLAERENPTIGIAREAVFANLALLQQAQGRSCCRRSSPAATFTCIRAPCSATTGEILNVNSQSLYVGGGAGAIGAGTVAIPAVRIYAPSSNALFEPLVARQGVAVSRFEARAASNTVLLDVVLRYFDLIGGRGQPGCLLAIGCRRHATGRYGGGLRQGRPGPQGRCRSAETRSLLVRNQVYRADERVGVAAAQLARLLDLDPSVRLQTVQGPVQRDRRRRSRATTCASADRHRLALPARKWPPATRPSR